MVCAKTPLAGPAAVLDRLSRHPHRTAVGNERLVGIAGDKVLLRVRADDRGGKRTIAVPAAEFVGRLLQHVLPPGFKRIWHDGLLAPATNTRRLALARELLAMAAANPRATKDAQAFIRRVAQLGIDACRHRVPVVIGSLPSFRKRLQARRSETYTAPAPTLSAV